MEINKKHRLAVYIKPTIVVLTVGANAILQAASEENDMLPLPPGAGTFKSKKSTYIDIDDEEVDF